MSQVDRAGETRASRRLWVLGIIFAIEFVDELVGSGMDAAWPSIRDELGLTYAHIGLLLSLPAIISSIVDPFVAIWGDIGKRRLIVLGGGVLFALALLARGASPNVGILLASLIVFYPASSTFVNLTQADLIDQSGTEHEVNMSRWAFAGSLGMVLGPVVMGGLLLVSVGWRAFFLVAGVVSLGLVFARFRSTPRTDGAGGSVAEAWRAVKDAFRSRGVLRWLILVQCGDFMIDLLLGFLALYMADVAGVSDSSAALAVAVWTGVGLAGDFLVIPLLRRVKGLLYLRASAAVAVVVFPLFLLVPSFALKVVLLGVLGLLNSGWYSVLMAQIYATLPGKSGTALALFNISTIFGALVPLALGLIAGAAGLDVAMWLLLVGPVALLVGIRKKHVVAAYVDVDET